ncbi:MAG: MarR family transcriptional regulator [Firmicutes bacterium GWF2_51_9]|nr:MarR family transcriptional regulator [Erysipelotrichaceae bacterium]OGS54787.1 MAG: MarR family transcriptional regulator [Firmicutes bacterium GWF2_51_9]OGS58879.1 MAG: MarR family transcriptional regulator [Firmicutes bacterium GWE2_51_13]HAM63522.1 MarR family transcriptional regulator [Erysipelotrichaceae bacterium]HAO60680.1 MarR family transcriptional regulator [Erysipelotrichaceae bacterium]
MKDTKRTLNELLVYLFNHILFLEEKNLKDQGIRLSMTEVHTLENIEKSSSKTMSDIAKLQMVTQGTLTVAVNRLVKKGFVWRERDKEDKRVIRLELTPVAKEVLKVHDRFHESMIDSLIADMKVDDDVNLMTSLDKIMEYFKKLG